MRKKHVFERCVICHKITSVLFKDPINRRSGYLEGVGQLCSDCYHAMDSQQSYRYKRKSDAYERCVLCNSETGVLATTDVDDRQFYVIGVGQLCCSCYKNVV